MSKKPKKPDPYDRDKVARELRKEQGGWWWSNPPEHAGGQGEEPETPPTYTNGHHTGDA